MPNQIAVRNVPQFDTRFFANGGQRETTLPSRDSPRDDVTKCSVPRRSSDLDGPPLECPEIAGRVKLTLSDETNRACRT
jgi:hypothetical protein